MLTSPFTPMLFMGEEWAASTPWQYFTSHEEPELAEAVRAGRRREFAGHGWAAEDVPDPQDRADGRGLDAGLVGAGQRPRTPRCSTGTARCCALRRAEPWLSDPRLDLVSVAYDAEQGWLVVQPRAAAGRVQPGAGAAASSRWTPTSTRCCWPPGPAAAAPATASALEVPRRRGGRGPRGRLLRVSADGFFGALLVGLVIGALGRLVVPGRQPIGCLFTILIGIVGSVAGLAIARAADLDWWLVVLACQVAVAAVGVAVVAAALRAWRRPPPGV